MGQSDTAQLGLLNRGPRSTFEHRVAFLLPSNHSRAIITSNLNGYQIDSERLSDDWALLEAYQGRAGRRLRRHSRGCRRRAPAGGEEHAGITRGRGAGGTL